MQAAEDREEGAILCHRVVNARRCHGKGHQAACDGEQYARRENFAARRAEKRLSKLRDKGSIRNNPLERHNGKKGKADQQINGGDQQYPAGEGQRESSAWVAHFAGELARFPPSSKTEEGVYGSARDCGKECIGAGPAR